MDVIEIVNRISSASNPTPAAKAQQREQVEVTGAQRRKSGLGARG